MAFRSRQALAAQQNSRLFSSSEDSQSATSVSLTSSSACTTTTATTSYSNYEITDSGNSTMKVVVRVRPENETEIRSNYQPVVKMLDEHVLVFDPSSDNEPSFHATSELLGKRRPALGKKHKDLRFAFDHVFDETASQSDVFQHTTESIVDGVLDGINCSVFAYGATGAGKTFTMLGNLENPGVMFLTMMELYRRIDELKDDKICEVAVSYCEVYNETIRDLLVPSAPLDLREDGQKGLVVAGLSRHTPKTANEILSMLEIGNQNRTQHPTDANATSSRSHAVFQVFVHQKARTAGLSAQVTSAKMSLIDLAGSERATVTTNRGARLREGANINKSLLALGNCINALAENKGKAIHVPYRNSKLTRLLKDSLGGNCRTVMIANVSPSGLSYEDTYNTLKYADRAKQIKTKLVRNVVSVDFHVTKYKTIVIELTKEVAELKAKLDKKAHLPSSRHSYDPAEASRLQGLVKAVYSERCRLRKQMAELDTSEREALLKVSRKERDIQRIDTLSANEAKKGKISSRIDHLRRHVEEVQGQKEALNERLCANNEAIGRVQAEINTACSDSNKPGSQALRQLMDVVVEAKKLEAENAHQWRMTKLLLKFIKNQEREITKTEKLLVFSLQLVQRQHTMLRASQTLTPNLQDSYDTIVRLAEGEKGVAWADQSNFSSDGLLDVSTSNFTRSQHALFDNLLVSASPRSRMSDVGGGGSIGNLNSPFPISTSLGILTTANSKSARFTPHHVQNGSSANTPLSTSIIAAANASVGSATRSTNTTPRLHQSGAAQSGSGLYQRRQELVSDSEREELPPISNSAFRNSPFVHRTTVSAAGVKCVTSINGMRAVTIASSNNAGPSNLLNQQLPNSGNNVQIASSAGTSTGVMNNGNVTPVRVTTPAKTENLVPQKLPRSHLGDMDSVLDTRFHSHFKDLGSDSSQGSTSMYSTQCVVTNRHMHVSNCAHTPTARGGVSLSSRKASEPLSNPGSPREISRMDDQPSRPKSANGVLHPQSCRFTAFTPVRTPGGRSNAKLSDPQTPSFSSNSTRVGAGSSSHEGLPKTSPGGRKMSWHGNGISGDVPSPYLIPRSRTESKNMTDFHSRTTSTTAGQPAFSVPPSATNSSNNSQGYSGYVSFSSQVNPGSMSQLPSTVRPRSPSQQSQSLSISSDSSTNCVVDMHLSTKPRPAFQTVLNNKMSNMSHPVASSGSSGGSQGLSISTPQNGSVRTAVLPTRNFCTFEDNFVSPRNFGSMGAPIAKTPTGATGAAPSSTNTATPLSSNLSRSGPLHRQFPPSVSSRSNYFSGTSSHDGLNKMYSPGAPATSSTNNYTTDPSASNNLSNPYSANVCSNLHRGAKSAPHLTTSRFQSGFVPPQSPGVMANNNNKTYMSGAPSTAPVQYQTQSLPPHESQSHSDDSADHIYQSIEAPPPPLPPPRSRNIYVPRPQGTPGAGGVGTSGHTSFSSKVQSLSNDIVPDPAGYAKRLIRPYTAGSVDTYKKSSSLGGQTHANSNILNETFTIEPSSTTDEHTLPMYQRHKIIRPNTAPDQDRDGGNSNFGGGGGSSLGSGGKSSNPYVQHPRHHHHSYSNHGNHHQQQHTSGSSSHSHHISGVDRKLPSYLQMTKSAASKRVPREHKLSSVSGAPPSSSSSHHHHHTHTQKAQDKENKGRTSANNKTHHSTKSNLTSSSSKWNRRHPSTSSNGSSSAFGKSVMRVHHGNDSGGTPLSVGGGLLRSREPTTASA